jgi:hypothetical protein
MDKKTVSTANAAKLPPNVRPLVPVMPIALSVPPINRPVSTANAIKHLSVPPLASPMPIVSIVQPIKNPVSTANAAKLPLNVRPLVSAMPIAHPALLTKRPASTADVAKPLNVRPLAPLILIAFPAQLVKNPASTANADNLPLLVKAMPIVPLVKSALAALVTFRAQVKPVMQIIFAPLHPNTGALRSAPSTTPSVSKIAPVPPQSAPATLLMAVPNVFPLP